MDFVLLARGLQQADGLQGDRVEVRITHHHANILGIEEQQLLHHGRECLAGFAGRIEHLDHGHARILRAKDR